RLLSRSALDGPSAPQLCTLSLHDALPISRGRRRPRRNPRSVTRSLVGGASSPPTDGSSGKPSTGAWAAESPRNRISSRPRTDRRDRKSTRLNSSHVKISYAVFCLKKKKHA